MSRADGLGALIEELRGLDQKMLELTLGALGRSEQAQILSLLEDGAAPALNFETLAGISPWLMARVDAARIAAKAPATAAGMTAAARGALLAAFAGLGSPQDRAIPPQEKRSFVPAGLFRLGSRKKAA